MQKHLHLAAALLACLLWAGSPVATKIALESLGPMSMGFFRFLAAAIAFFIIFLIKKEPWPSPKVIGLCAATGLIGISFYYAAENFSLSLLPASTAALICGAFPAFTLVAESIVDKKLPSARMTVGITLAIFGVSLIGLFEKNSSTGAESGLGYLVLLLAGLCWAAYNLLMRPLVHEASTLSISCWQSLFGFLGFVPFTIAEGFPASFPPSSTWLALAYLILLCTLLAFFLYNWGFLGLSPTAASSTANMIPVFGLIFSVLILGEPLNILQVVGGALVVVGVFVSSEA